MNTQTSKLFVQHFVNNLTNDAAFIFSLENHDNTMTSSARNVRHRWEWARHFFLESRQQTIF